MIQKLKKCSFAAIKHGTCVTTFVRMEVSNIVYHYCYCGINYTQQ